MNNVNNNNCTENSKLWTLIYKLQRGPKFRNTKLILTSEERFNLCNYINGKPYDKKVLHKFIS